MTSLAAVCAGILIASVLLRAYLTFVFLCNTQSTGLPAALPDPAPRVSVFMPVRGADPHLPQAIQSLLDQDYPNFDVRIVVDSSQDEGWEVVQQTLRDLHTTRVSVSELMQRCPTCSLVCNALLQFVDEVGERSELVTFCASDMVVAKNWMREMVAALTDPSVGTTMGNRWYMASTSGWGTLVRYLWNVIGNVNMWHHGILWGGTVCLRVKDVHRARLPALWATSMVEDVPLRSALARIGLSVKYVPELIVVNRDEISLGQCIRFLTRQMFWTHTYATNAIAFLMFAVLVGPTTVALLVLLPLGVYLGQPAATGWSAAALLLQIAVATTTAGLLESRVRRMMRRRGEVVTPIPIHYFWRLPFAVLLAQLVVCYAILVSRFMRRMSWRGVTYQIDGPFNVRLIADERKDPGPLAAVVGQPTKT